MVVGCPKCKTKLKVDESRIVPEGSRFKCPKCATVLLVKKPAVQVKKTLDSKKILVAHSVSETLNKMASILMGSGYKVVTAADGIDVMVKALKELPAVSIIEVALPKIYGFEVCKRLKARDEAKEMKMILIPAIHDKTKYRRDPASLYGADEYLEEFAIDEKLVSLVKGLLEPKKEELKEEERPFPVQQPAVAKKESAEITAPKPASVSEAPSPDERVERARRLARTIVNDIYLYNTAKADEVIKTDGFYGTFVNEIREGQKLYESRIPQEVRGIKDFYREAIDNFIASKKGA